MNWTRFDSNARAHAKLVKAGNDAASWWAFAVMWSNLNGTDGYLDGTQLGNVMPVPIANDMAKALAELCVRAVIKPGGVGLLVPAEDGYNIHDFAQFQPPADESEKRAWLHQKRSDAGKLGAASRWQTDGKANGKVGDSRVHARASVRSGSDRKEGGPGEEKNLTGAAPGGELAARVWDELWSAKYKSAYVHSTSNGPKSERVSLERLEQLAIARASESSHSPDVLIRYWIRAYLKDSDIWPVENRHPIRGLDARINKYGEPKRPRSSEPPKVEPVHLNGAAHPRKAATPESLARAIDTARGAMRKA